MPGNAEPEPGKLKIDVPPPISVSLLDVNRNTAKLHIRKLVANGYLVQHGTGKAT